MPASKCVSFTGYQPRADFSHMYFDTDRFNTYRPLTCGKDIICDQTKSKADWKDITFWVLLAVTFIAIVLVYFYFYVSKKL